MVGNGPNMDVSTVVYAVNRNELLKSGEFCFLIRQTIFEKNAIARWNRVGFSFQ